MTDREKYIQALSVDALDKIVELLKDHSKQIQSSMEQSYYLDNIYNRMSIILSLNRNLR